MSEKDYDVIVIGGGIVGCSVLFELTCQGYSCLLVEKQRNLLSGASCGNSGMLHTGFDAPANSLELKCIQACQERVFPVLDTFNVPFSKCGTCLVAWNSQEKTCIPQLQQRCEVAGVFDAQILTPSDLYQKEPFLKSTAEGALFVPGESVVDSNTLGIMYAHHAWRQGARIITNCEVQRFEDDTVYTDKGSFTTHVTVNCAGLYGDMVDEFAGIKTFSILPRKGHFSVFGKNAQTLVNSIIFPIPTKRSKGVGLYKSVYGNVIIGPTAEDVKDRGQPSFDAKTHNRLLSQARCMMPALEHYQCVGHYAGVRPATEFKDFQITSYPSRHWISVGGIRSTGVSASLGIAEYVAERVCSDMNVESRRGPVRHIESLQWTFEDNGSSININGKKYETTHPICHFGNQNSQSRL